MNLHARPRRLGRRTSALALSAATALTLSACGTRLSDTEAADQISAAYGATGGLGNAGTTGGTGSAGTDGGTTTGGTTDGGATTGGTTTGGSTTGAGTTTGGSTTGAGTTTGGSTTGGGTTGGSTTGGGTKAPLVLGMTGNWSGVIGAAQAPARDAYQAWAQSVNSKGGINGHPVRLLNSDDRNSAANDIAAAKNFVEQQKAIAIVNLWPAAGSIGSVAKYAQSRKVPVIGGNGYDPEWNAFPSMFPITTSSTSQNYAWAAAMKDSGVTRVGAIFCSEAPICENKKNEWRQYAAKLGMQVLYEGQSSLAAPSFTRECSEAQGRQVQALVPIMDGASANRISRDCSRQQFFPKYVVPQPFNTAPAGLDGAIAPITAFPWFLTSGNPGIEEYTVALKKYVRNAINSYSSVGWVNAKLAEKALTIATGKKENPTGADVIEALLSLKNDTLGGLAVQPITFVRNKPAPDIRCSFKVVATKDGEKWTAPIGLRPTYCRNVNL